MNEKDNDFIINCKSIGFVMTLPKKRRGFRKIIVNNIIYNWRFCSYIDIRPNENKNNRLLIDVGWYDVWLYVNNPKSKSKNTFPQNITPKLIERLINESIRIGWDIEKNNQTFILKYINEEDRLVIKTNT